MGKVIDKYDYRKSNKKAQLDSNVHGAIDHEAEIRRITNTNLPIIDKMQRLNFLADSYNLKCEQGKTEALSLLCQVSLARANIFLSAQ